MIPPASICAPELMTLDDGSGSLRVSTDAIDQLIDPMRSATAPALLIGAPPRYNEWLISTATPPIPTRSASARRIVSLWVRRTRISDSAMNTGIVAIMTAAMPEGTRCSAQNNSP